MATIETRLLYQVFQVIGGKEVHLKWFDNKDAGHNYVDEIIRKGGDADVRPYDKQVVVTSTPEIYLLGERVLDEYVSQSELRERALRKLTTEERKALGV